MEISGHHLETMTAVPDGQEDNLRPFHDHTITHSDKLSCGQSVSGLDILGGLLRYTHTHTHTHTSKHVSLYSLAPELMTTHFAGQTATIGTICAGLSQLISRLILKSNLQIICRNE